MNTADVTGPLAHFQATEFRQRDDVFRMITTINNLVQSPLSESRLANAFAMCWPDFRKTIDDIAAKYRTKGKDAAPIRTADEITPEILDLLRAQGKILAEILAAYPPAGSAEGPDRSMTSAEVSETTIWLARLRGMAEFITSPSSADGVDLIQVRGLISMLASKLSPFIDRSLFDATRRRAEDDVRGNFGRSPGSWPEETHLSPPG